jgi:electron transport complex protein RnfA
MEYISLIILAVFVNNVVLSQFFGLCPFFGVSSKVETSLGMGGAVIFVITIATVITYLVYHYILVPINIAYLETVCFILIIAALVQMVEIILKKVSPALYQALGIFLPLITTNCAVLGVALLVIQKDFNLIQSTLYGFGIAVGFSLALVIFAGIREQLELNSIPKGIKGMPIAMITAGILAMAFMGFTGLVK